MTKDRQVLKSHADVGGGDGDSGDGGSGSASDHGFRSLWRVGSHHTSDLCPPEPAHQRALNLLPMDSADMKTGGAACSARDMLSFYDGTIPRIPRNKDRTREDRRKKRNRSTV